VARQGSPYGRVGLRLVAAALGLGLLVLLVRTLSTAYGQGPTGAVFLLAPGSPVTNPDHHELANQGPVGANSPYSVTLSYGLVGGTQHVQEFDSNHVVAAETWIQVSLAGVPREIQSGAKYNLTVNMQANMTGPNLSPDQSGQMGVQVTSNFCVKTSGDENLVYKARGGGQGRAVYECTAPAGADYLDFMLLWRTQYVDLSSLVYYRYDLQGGSAVAVGPTLTPKVSPTPETQAAASCTATDPSKVTGAVKTVFSTPKNRPNYVYEAGLSKLLFQRQGGATLDKLYAAGSGELEMAFCYLDAGGITHTLSLPPQRLAALKPQDDADRNRRAGAGQMFFSSARILDVGWQALDQFESMAADAGNSREVIDKKRETIARGSKLLLDWVVSLRDGQGLLATYRSGEPVRYVLRYPLIFLPGTAGTRLSADDQEIWPANLDPKSILAKRGIILTPSDADRAYWQPLALSPQLTSTAVVSATDIFRYYGQTQGIRWVNVYIGFLDHLKANGYVENKNLFVFPYDWRLGADGHEGRLDALVNQALELNYNRRAGSSSGPAPVPAGYARQPGDKVILISHSLGGLVIRRYVGDPSRAAKVAQVIMLGPTNSGSIKAERAIWTVGYNFEAPFINLEVAKWIARNWPGAYEQFPFDPSTGDLDKVFFDNANRVYDDPTRILLDTRTHVFCATHVLQTGPECQVTSLNAELLAAAVASHKTLVNPVSVGVTTTIIIDWDQVTPLGFQLEQQRVTVTNLPIVGTKYVDFIPHFDLARWGNLPPDTIFQDQYRIVDRGFKSYTVELPHFAEVTVQCGDNLVPLARAVLPSARMIYIRGVKHGEYTESTVVQTLIDRILAGVGPAADPEPKCGSRLVSTIGSAP
jgi:hypothetical protein